MYGENFIIGNAKIVRSINRSTILNAIREKQPISRSKLAKLTGLTKTTVSSIVSDLLAEGFIFEQFISDAKVGRNPILLRLKLNENYVGAIDIGPDTTIVAVADIDGSIIRKAYLKTDVDHAAAFISTCIEKLHSLKSIIRIEQLRGVGVSIAGIVDVKKGRVAFAPNLGWKNLDVATIFCEHCKEDGPMVLENEANSSALAELWFGHEVSQMANFVFIAEGLGTGLIFGRQLFDGSTHAAGEFSHTTIVEDGERCVCGNDGCWEAYASNRAIMQKYKRLKRHHLDITIEEHLEFIIDQAKKGEPEAMQALKETGRYLGLGISNIIKALDPDAVVFGGMIIRAWDIIYPEILNEVNRRSLSGIDRKTLILPSSLTERSSLIGAATLIVREIFAGHKITR